MSKIIDLILKRTPENKEILNDEIAFISKDPNHKYVNDHPFYKMADILNKQTKQINEFQTTFSQSHFLDNLTLNNFFIAQAGTGFGKTWLTSNQRKENEIYIHIVPNDILVAQGIWQLGDKASSEFNFSEKKYIFTTPEKLFGNLEYILNNFYKINKIIFDECHIIFENEDSRASFYKFIIKILTSEKTNDQQFVFLSPFLKDENIKEITKILEHDVVFNRYEGFTSEYVTANFDNQIIENYNYDEILQANKNMEGIELQYFTSAQQARAEFVKEIEEKKLLLVDFISKISNIPLLYDAWKNIQNNALENYDVIKGITNGIVLYHSNIPDNIKNFIFVLAKANFLTKIYGTSALLNGADLTINKIKIHSTKIGKKQREMSMNEFLNLSGRSGRYNPSIDRIFGFIEFKRTETNGNWLEKNQDNILKRTKIGNYETNDEELKWFTDISSKMAIEDVEKREIVLADPRINPNTSIELFNNPQKALELRNNILELLECNYNSEKERGNPFGNIRWNDQQKALDLVKPIFDFYKDSLPEGGFKFNDIKPENTNKIKAIRLFIKYMKTFSENKIIEGYSWYYFIENYDEDTSNNKFEDVIAIIKNNVKFEIMLIFNHVFLINNLIHGTFYNLYDMITFKTNDTSLINYIRKNRIESSFEDFLVEIKKPLSKYRFKAVNLSNFKEYVNDNK